MNVLLNNHCQSSHRAFIFVGSEDFSQEIITTPKKQTDSSNDEQAKLKILVVEDNFINQKAACALLEGEGYAVELAVCGKDALYMATTNNYDLILMDIGLPDISGIEVTKRIRAAETGEPVPIIACTANDKSDKAKCLAAGMNEFTQKPIEIEGLKQVFARFVKN